MTTKREPVGDAECPIKGCAEAVPVFKYEAASGDTKRRRFAGKLYCSCPIHGRVENQEYLLEKITWRDGKKDTGNASNASPSPETKPPEPTRAAPVKPAPETPPKPAPRPAPKAKPQEQAKEPKRSSWLPDFWSEK